MILGASRAVDQNGRIQIPSDIRQALNLSTNDLVNVVLEGEAIIIRRENKVCSVCGSRPEYIKGYCRQCFIKYGLLEENR